jgi:hypothetical protein
MCQKTIDGKGREIVDVMKVDERLYEQYQGAYKTSQRA